MCIMLMYVLNERKYIFGFYIFQSFFISFQVMVNVLWLQFSVVQLFSKVSKEVSKEKLEESFSICFKGRYVFRNCTKQNKKNKI